MKLPILGLTSAFFADKIKQSLGKGEEHALCIYKEWLRSAAIPKGMPLFKNAQGLLRSILDQIDFSYLPIIKRVSEQSTHKILLKTASGLEIESVVIPMQAGLTLCISSQVGCKMACAFCETGRMGLLKNLQPWEIVSQVFAARNLLQLPIRNIVFMGMGEPFDNYENVMEAFKVLTDPQGFCFGERHITISTSGLVPYIERLMLEPFAIPNLAVSINSADEAQRKKLMPITRKYGLKQLYEAMSAFNSATKREILIGYVLIKGENDSLEHAEILAEYLKGLKVKINLIPYNAQSQDRFHTSELSQIAAFKEHLRKRGYRPLLRLTKGSQIMAACGQLGNISRKLKPLLNELEIRHER